MTHILGEPCTCPGILCRVQIEAVHRFQVEIHHRLRMVPTGTSIVQPRAVPTDILEHEMSMSADAGTVSECSRGQPTEVEIVK